MQVEKIIITDYLKDICNQFKSGGTAKERRGILDDYYTDSKIVAAVRNLISDQFKNKKEISVLEPSVVAGKFINDAQGLGVKSKITAFEINETTAKIAKIFHSETSINLRSFETEFIDEKGVKKYRANIEIELIKKRLESEKNKHLAESTFVLRKYEDFTRVQSELTKAEILYNRIKEYAASSADSNSEYWKNQLPFYQKAIDLAKAEVKITIANLAAKGVKVTVIEKQIQSTLEKIKVIEAQIEELPYTKGSLLIQYLEEKGIQLSLNLNKDCMKERGIENRMIFKIYNLKKVAPKINSEKIIQREISYTFNKGLFSVRL